MDGKTIIVGIAALILGGLGGFMLGGSQSSQAVTQEKLQMMMSDPQTREMMVDEVMSNEEAKQMVDDKLMMDQEDETMMEVEDSKMEDESMTEDDSMMKDEDTMMEDDSMMGQ